MNITAYTQSGETVRLSIPAPTWEGRENHGTGVTLAAIYVSPRAQRCVVETYSIWDDGTGRCVGTSYRLIEDHDELNRLASRFPEVGEALENAGIVTAESL